MHIGQWNEKRRSQPDGVRPSRRRSYARLIDIYRLLQVQSGSASLTAVIEAMSSASKDMLANRRATMATARAIPISIVAKASANALGDPTSASPARLSRPSNGTGTPKSARHVPEYDTGAAENSPASHGPSRSTANPTTCLPKSSTASSASRGIPALSALPRANVPSPTARLLQQPSDLFRPSSKPSMQPLKRAVSGRISDGSDTGDVIRAAIDDLRHDDPDKVVDSLKLIQRLLTDEPGSFLYSIETLVDALLDAMDRAFTPTDTLLVPQYFRLVKHLIQTFSGISSNQDLLRRLKYDNIYSLLSGLTLHLVEADKMGGSVQELVKFFNMILLQVLSTPDRLLVFKAMFRLLLSLSIQISTHNIQPDTDMAVHADLVIRCLWKRCKILDDDFRSGRLQPGALLGVVEEFLQAISPQEFRRRRIEGLALGDMPLRTVKSVIQRVVREYKRCIIPINTDLMIVYAKENGQEVYDILLGEFGDAAAGDDCESSIASCQRGGILILALGIFLCFPPSGPERQLGDQGSSITCRSTRLRCQSSDFRH